MIWRPSNILGGPSYNAKAHLLRVKHLHEKYPLNDIDKCNAFTLDIFKEVYGKQPPWLVIDQVEELILLLFDQNSIYCPNVPTSEDREILTLRERELASHDRITIARAALVQFLKTLPLPASVYEQHKPTPDEQVAEALGKTRPSKTGPSVALSTFIPDLAEHISHAIHVVANTKHGEHRIFPSTWHDISMNIDALSGSTTKYILPSEYKDDPCHYVGGTPFAALFNAQVPFEIGAWDRHGICIAPSGHGKSQLLQSFIAQRIREPDPIGFFFLDPHGDSFDVVAPRVDPSRLVVINPDDPKHRPSLNFLDFRDSTEPQVRQTFEYLMSSLSGGLSDKQGAIVPYLLKLLRNIEGASLETLRRIVDEKVKTPDKSQFAPAIAKLPTVDQGFFHSQFYHPAMDATKQAIGWKIYSAMSSEIFREMFGSSQQSNISFDQLIADRKVVIVKGARNSLGDDGMRIFLQFMLAQYFAAGLRRERLPPNQRRLNLMYVDEASFLLSSPIISSMCVELRKFQCALWMATQVYEQIGVEVRAAILGSVGTKICGPISFSDANVLSREMNTTPDFIRSMKAVERSHADWAFFVSGLTDKAVRVKVPYGVLEAMPKSKAPIVITKETPQAERPRPPAPGQSHQANVSPGGAHLPLPDPATKSADADKGVDAPQPLIKPGKEW